MDWLEICLDTTTERIDLLCAKLEGLGIDSFTIEDEADLKDFIKNGKKYWDYIDEELEESLRGVCRIKFYLEDDDTSVARLEEITAALPGESLSTAKVRDEDWENNWKQYYKPIKVGKKLYILPDWETEEAPEGRVTLRLDPGLIFGTGGHATTQLCLEELEKLASPGKKVLDLGCGSGILSIAALLLGCSGAVGCDIDEKAPAVAVENAAKSGVAERFSAICGDILAPDGALLKKFSREKYDVVLANIVSDVLIALSPVVPSLLTEGGAFICSGIIDGREEEVKSAIESAGLEIYSAGHRENWHCFAAVARRRDG